MKNTTTTTSVNEHIIADYKEFQELIGYTTTYTGTTPLAPGSVVNADELKTAMNISGHIAKKLRPTDQVKAGGTVYKYLKKDGTVSRYAMTKDLVSKDHIKQFQTLLKDLNTKLMRGDIDAATYAVSVADLAKTQATL